MNFVSAADLAKHLRALVDDEDFIERTVKVHFPEYKKEVRAAGKFHRAVTREEQTRSLRTDPETFTLDSERDIVARKEIVHSADTLLRAIHREHPKIMRDLHDLGNRRRAQGLDGPVVVWP